MIPSELLGSLPRIPKLHAAAVESRKSDGKIPAGFKALQREAVQQTLADLEEIGSYPLSDGEQSKPSYLTYSVAGLHNIMPDGVVVQYIDGHGRRLPRLTEGPFAYTQYAGDYVREAMRFTDKPLKQAVISPATMFLIYPKSGVLNYSPVEFLNDVIGQAEMDLRSCLAQRCKYLQIDSPEMAMAIHIDSSGELLQKFISVSNLLLDRFSPSERLGIGIHICSGCDQGSSFCTENEYCHLLKEIFKLHVDKVYLPLQKFKHKDKVLQTIRQYANAWNKIYLGVTDVRPGNPLASSKEVAERIKFIAKYLPLHQIGTTDDCGFASFADADSVSRSFALNAIRARLDGSKML